MGAGVRDCSIQRRNQKLIEESSSPALSAEQERGLRAAAVNLVRSAGYRSVGTVEFLYQPDEQAFAFLEVNTRLQFEHPVTEMTTGLDLVKLQLHVAGGGQLEGEPPPASGHAIEVRLNAEDPERGFAPAFGTVELLMLPSGPGVRVETGVAEGDVIPPEYDSMVAKVVGWGRDRAEARARLRRALAETAVVVRGGTTNKAFLLDLLDRPEMIAGVADTGWLDRLVASDGHIPTRHADVALLAAAIDIYDSEEELERGGFYAAASSRPAPGEPRDRPDGRPPPPRPDVPSGCRADGPRVVTRSRPTARPSTCRSSPSAASRAGLRSAGGRSRSTRSPTARITWWRSTASPIACRETREGSCGPPRRRSSWP